MKPTAHDLRRGDRARLCWERRRLVRSLSPEFPGRFRQLREPPLRVSRHHHQPLSHREPLEHCEAAGASPLPDLELAKFDPEMTRPALIFGWPERRAVLRASVPPSAFALRARFSRGLRGPRSSRAVHDSAFQTRRWRLKAGVRTQLSARVRAFPPACRVKQTSRPPPRAPPPKPCPNFQLPLPRV